MLVMARTEKEVIENNAIARADRTRFNLSPAGVAAIRRANTIETQAVKNVINIFSVLLNMPSVCY